jgi:hypothetical protein
MVVDVEPRGELKASAPHVLFHAPIQSAGSSGPTPITQSVQMESVFS